MWARKNPRLTAVVAAAAPRGRPRVLHTTFRMEPNRTVVGGNTAALQGVETVGYEVGTR